MKNEFIHKIIRLEWSMFDAVRNAGGRAACQDDPHTFVIMRSSQLSAWTEPLLKSYYHDLSIADICGDNLVTKKYAAMMQTTHPEEYRQFTSSLIAVPSPNKLLIEKIIAVHLGWMQLLFVKYPRLTGNGRPLYTSCDTAELTSYETYLRGELSTYSLHTLALYDACLRTMLDGGENINALILLNTVRQYGYASLEQAEEQTAAG